MGRNFLITGASSDIGLALIRALDLDDGDTIIAHYKSSKSELEKIAGEKHIPMRYLYSDFSSSESRTAFLEQLGQLEVKPNYIIHLCAAAVELKRFRDYSIEDFENSYAVQVLSIVEILQYFLPEMAKSKSGTVIFMLSSCVLNRPPRFWADYVTAKYALLGLMKSLVSEYAQKNIRFNAISPSMTETKFLQNIYDKAIEQAALQNPMKRNAKTKDIVPALLYLISGQSEFLNGVNIPVTGGSEF